MKTRGRGGIDSRRDHPTPCRRRRPVVRAEAESRPSRPRVAMAAATTKTACCACPSGTPGGTAQPHSKALLGSVAFLASIWFSDELWKVVKEPAASALKSLGYQPDLVQITPMEVFNILWVKLPILAAVFLSRRGFFTRCGVHCAR